MNGLMIPWRWSSTLLRSAGNCTQLDIFSRPRRTKSLPAPHRGRLCIW